MSTDPSNKDPKISSADDLVKTTNSSDVELSEEELSLVTGGKSVANIKWTPGNGTTNPPATP